MLLLLLRGVPIAHERVAPLQHPDFLSASRICLVSKRGMSTCFTINMLVVRARVRASKTGGLTYHGSCSKNNQHGFPGRPPPTACCPSFASRALLRAVVPPSSSYQCWICSLSFACVPACCSRALPPQLREPQKLACCVPPPPAGVPDKSVFSTCYACASLPVCRSFRCPASWCRESKRVARAHTAHFFFC